MILVYSRDWKQECLVITHCPVTLLGKLCGFEAGEVIGKVKRCLSSEKKKRPLESSFPIRGHYLDLTSRDSNMFAQGSRNLYFNRQRAIGSEILTSQTSNSLNNLNSESWKIQEIESISDLCEAFQLLLLGAMVKNTLGVQVVKLKDLLGE